MSRDVLTVGSTMRIPLLYRGEYSQWVERFMNYLEEQTDEKEMINSIKNGDQPLPRVTQVSIAETTSTEQPPLKNKSKWSDQEKRCGYSKDSCELNFKFLNNLQPEWKQYATMMRQNKNLMDINIEALYNILKQNQGDVNDAIGSKKKTVMVTSDPLALIAEKTNGLATSGSEEAREYFSDLYCKPLVLSWGRTPRLDSGVRVRAHIISENVRVCVCKVGSENCTLWGVRVPIFIGSARNCDLRTLIPFRGCLLVRERPKGLVYLLYVIKSPSLVYLLREVLLRAVDIARLRFRCLTILLSCSAAAYLSVAFLFIGSITDIRSVLTQRALTIFCETYHISDEVHPQLPSPNQTIHEMPSGKIGVYTMFFEYANFRNGVPKDPFPKSSKFNAEHFATFVALPAPFHKYPELFLCLVGISRYYTLDEDAYPEFLGDNDEGMDLLAFIRTADPTKVKVAERQRAEDEPRLLESTVGRVVPLLPIAPARASSELEASVDKLFDEGASGDGQDTDVQPVAKLREDYRALGGASTAGKSMSAVQSLFTGAVLDAEARGEPIPTLPFVTSSVSATPEHSSHHSGANIAEAEVDTIVRSSASAIATVTTVTAVIDADTTATRAPVAPSLFGVGSSSTGRTNSVPDGFSDVSGSDFLIGGIRTVVDPDSDLQKVYVPRWSATNGFGLDDRCICREMLDEFAPKNSLPLEKRKLKAVVDEQEELLKVKDGEIESLKAQLLLKEAEAAEAIRLWAEVFKFEFAKQSLWSEVKEQEVAALDAQVTAVKLQNDNLVGQVHELEISSAGLQEKVVAYEGFVSQLEKLHDEKLEEVNEKFDKLCADFIDMALHLEEKFYPHLLTTISGRRWLLTYGMGLAVVKWLNSTEYLSALGAAISKAVEKGMQEGLSAGITHGAKGRQLADVAAYNPSTEADYLSALQHLHNVNFSLIAELKSNKDASVDTIMNLLRLDDVLAERLGMEGTFGSTYDATTTFVSASTIPPISTDDYEVAHADGQGGAGVDDETAVVDDMNLFVSNAELNISE
nr:transposase (putative), gypsy type [Tanacetum cinerariifolium]